MSIKNTNKRTTNDQNTVKKLNLWLLRHGETTANSQLAGQTDIPLTEFGWRQMQDACANITADRIFSSPLRRCREFAENLSQDRQISLSVIDAIGEINFGDWDGQSWSQIDEEQSLQYFTAPWHFTPPNGEPLTQFDSRIATWFDHIDVPEKSADWLIICHGGVIKAAVGWALSLSGTMHQCYTQLQIDHASLSKIQISSFDDSRQKKVVFVNRR